MFQFGASAPCLLQDLVILQAMARLKCDLQHSSSWRPIVNSPSCTAKSFLGHPRTQQFFSLKQLRVTMKGGFR